MPVIGFLGGVSPDGVTERLRAFRDGLKDSGYIEGENVTIIYRWADNQLNLVPELASELRRQQVAVIIALGGDAGARCSGEGGDHNHPHSVHRHRSPVRLGLVSSLARPGGNVTGINLFSGELSAKRLEFLRELVPAATRVAVLVNPTGSTAETTLRDVEAAARPFGLQIRALNANTSREIDAALATFVPERPEGLFVSSYHFHIRVMWQYRGRT